MKNISPLTVERLTMIADHLMNGIIGHAKFSFAAFNVGPYKDGSIVPGCGSVGCAVGEFPIIWPDKWHFTQEPEDHYGVKGFMPHLRDAYPLNHPEDGLFSNSVQDDVVNWLDLSKHHVGMMDDIYCHLFIPMSQQIEVFGGKLLSVDASKEEVAQNIYSFINKYK